MFLNLILFFLYIFCSNEEIIKNGIYYIRFKNIILNFNINNLYLSEDFKYPNSFFRIKRQSYTLNESLYNIGKISSEYQLSYLENNQLVFQKNKNNLQLWYLIKAKNDKFIIKNRNGCFIIINNLNIFCSFNTKFKATEFNIINIYFEIKKNIKYNDSKLLNEEPIDVLIKYIDLHDPNLNRTTIHQIDKDYDNEELRYSVRSILTNIPWVRKIFILMPNERVRYFKNYNLIKDKIVYIKDKDILGYDSSNSNAFEFSYWKIKKFGLSDNVIVMDDDCFIGNKLRKNDFFYVDNGRVLPVIPTYNFIKLNKKNIEKKYLIYKKKAEKSKEEQNDDIFNYSKFLTLSFILTIFNISIYNTTFVPEFTHNAIPLNLKEIKEAYNIINNSIYKYQTLDAPYRHISSIQFQIFMLSYSFIKYGRKINNIPYKFIQLNNSISLDYNYSLFCINKGAGNYTLLNYNKAKIVMEYLFPIQTPYELINYSFVNISFYVSYILNMNLNRLSKIHKIMKNEFILLLLLISIFVLCFYFKIKLNYNKKNFTFL